MPGVSVIDLRVVDYSTLRLETGLDIEIFKLGLLLKMDTDEILRFSLAGRNDKDTTQRNYLRTQN